MKTTLFSGILILTVLFSSYAQKIEYGVFTEAKCPIEIPEELLHSEKFTYRYVSVPEFHNQSGSKAIELAVAVFKCRQDSAMYEPLILNSGGPEQSNIDDFIPALTGPVGNLFLNERDVVVIELRGLKYSRPSLETPELEQVQLDMLDKHLSADEVFKIYSNTVESIKRRLTEAGVNLSAYNYWETASDLVFVMKQLGYDRFFAFGSSAGSIVAQYLLMDHSEHIAGLVMNAEVDLEPGFNNMYVHTIEKLDRLFMEVEQNEACAEAYPDLKKRLLNTLDTLNESPEKITTIRPGHGDSYDIMLTGDRISVWLFGQMYWNTQLPLSIHKIINRDYSEIIGNPGVIFPLPSFSNGSFWSMVLNGWSDPASDQLPVEGEYKTFVEGTSNMVFGSYFTEKIRKIWGVDYTPGNIKSMATQVPTLMLNGDEDHLCSPLIAQELSNSFENSFCYIFNGIAHSPIDAGPCGIMLMKQFIDNPQAEPDASCLQDVRNEFILP